MLWVYVVGIRSGEKNDCSPLHIICSGEHFPLHITCSPLHIYFICSGEHVICSGEHYVVDNMVYVVGVSICSG